MCILLKKYSPREPKLVLGSWAYGRPAQTHSKWTLLSHGHERLEETSRIRQSTLMHLVK